eukprot:3934628-Rhodomonas_salina.1
MSGTDDMRVHCPYAVSGTETGYAATQELRAYFDELEPAGSLSLPTSAGQPPKLNVSDYFYKLDDKVCPYAIRARCPVPT